jgi:hypothetical protein
MGPVFSSVLSITLAMSTSLAASIAKDIPFTSEAVFTAPSASISAQIMLFAPSLAKRNAMAFPIPPAAPVTTIILSLSSIR